MKIINFNENSILIEKFIYIVDDISDRKKLPIIPEYVLFGLNFVSLGPLKILPKTYPPISVDTQIIVKNKKNQ